MHSVKATKLASRFPEISGLRFIRKEGKGACGTVYRVRDLKTNDLVAVKRLSRRLTARPKFLENVHAGIARLGTVHGEHVVKPLGTHKDETHEYVLTEFVEGENLRDVLRQRGRLPEEEAVDIISQAARGLEAAASAGQLHFDLKPANIAISDDGQVRLMDFFMEFHPYVRSVPAEQVFELKEFPLYISPEERDHGEVTVQSNIFSLGAVFHDLIYGAPLLDANGRRPEHWSLPAGVRVSPGIRKLILQMTADAPSQRFASYQQLQEALEHLAGGARVWQERALFAGTAGAFILTFALFWPGHNQEAPPAGAAEPATTAQTNLSDTRLREGDARSAFEKAEAFRLKSPAKATEMIARYRDIALRYPDSPYAFQAKQIAEHLEQLEKEAEARRWAELTSEVERLEKEFRYREAEERIRDLAARNPSASPDKVERLRRQVLAREAASFEEFRVQLVRIACLRGIAGVQKELDFVARHAFTPGIQEQAKEERGWLRQWLEGPASSSHGLRLNERARETEKVREWFLLSVLLLQQLRYEQALRVCREALKQVGSPQTKQSLEFYEKAIPLDRQFVNRVFSRVRRNECSPRPVVRGPDGRRKSVFWATSEGLTVSEQGDEKLKWAELSGLEISRLLEQAVQRNSPSEEAELARAFFLRGLWGKMSGALAQAVRGDPTFQATADAYHGFAAHLDHLLTKGE